MTHEISLFRPAKSWYKLAENLPKRTLPKMTFVAAALSTQQRINETSLSHFFSLITSLEESPQMSYSTWTVFVIKAYQLLTQLLTLKLFIL